MEFMKDQNKRHKYMAAKLRMDIAYQVRLLRLQRQMTQAELAEKCDTTQPAISKIEDWIADWPTIPTLRKIAFALDLGLVVKFDTWAEVWRSLIPSFEQDPYFKEVTTA